MKSDMMGVALLACAGVVGTPAIAQTTATDEGPAQTAAPDDDPSASSDDDGAIVVTANRRAENIQDVPISINVLTGDDLSSAGISNATQLQVTTPGLNIGTTVGVPQVYIRGMGTANLNSEGTVGLYLDGVYLPYAAAIDASLLDIERIEVLKGPQGTLYGRNTTAGAVNFITRDPSRERVAQVQATLGTYNTRAVQGYFATGPGTVAASIAGQYFHHGAYLGQDGVGPDLNDRDEINLRGRVRIELGPDWVATLAADYNQRDDYGAVGFIQIYDRPTAADPATGGQYSTPATPRRTNTNFPSNGEDFESYGGSLTIRGETPFANFVSITGYRDVSQRTAPDGDATSLPISAFNSLSINRNWSQEFQAISNGGGNLDWIVGLYAFDLYGGIGPTYVFNPGNLGGPGPEGADLIVNGYGSARAYAGYGQLSYMILEGFKITGGLRYSTERRRLLRQTVEVPGFGIVLSDPPDSRRFSSLDPKVGLEYSWGRQLLYASFTRGFRSGSYNLGSPGTPGPVRPETVSAFELGGKHTVTSGVIFNWALYHYRYSDLQVSRVLDNGQGSLFFNQNAASATSKGGEAELMVTAIPRVAFSLAAAYTDATYDSFPGAQAFVPAPNNGYGLITQAVDVSGQRLPRAPRFTTTLNFRYNLPIGPSRLELGGNLYYTSGYFLDTPSNIYQDGYAIVNARATFHFPDDRVSISVFANNLFDEVYIDSSSTNAAGFLGIPSDPRIVGVTASFRF